jgi:hypothetical protein
MTARMQTVRTAAIVVVTLAMNALLDLTLDLPMLVRWGIALLAVLVVLRVLDRRGPALRGGDEARRVPPDGRPVRRGSGRPGGAARRLTPSALAVVGTRLGVTPLTGPRGGSSTHPTP